MEAINKLMLDKTVIKMKKFNMKEIQQLFKILRVNLEWNDIISMVAKCRLRLCVGNVACVIDEYLKGTIIFFLKLLLSCYYSLV